MYKKNQDYAAPYAEISRHTRLRMSALCSAGSGIVALVAARLGMARVGGPLVGIVALLALVGCIWLMMQRTSYLPFLGPTVLPGTVLQRRTPTNATVIVDIPSKADTIVYWASEPCCRVKPTPWKAYKDFKNSGVVDVDKERGIAEVHVRCPGRYVAKGKVLPRHVHYREVVGSGMMGPVKTVGVICS